MIKRKIEEITQLSTQLDIFDPMPISEPQVLGQGFYTPLAITETAVLWGFNLIKHLQALGEREVYCITILENRKPQQLKLALQLENRAGKYSWLEKERMLKFLENPKNWDKELNRLVEAKEEPSLIQHIQEYQHLPLKLKEMVATNQMDIKTALYVQELPEELFTHIWEKDIRLTYSQQRILLIHLTEWAKRQGLTKEEINQEFTTILNSKKPLEYAKKLRYPELSKMEEEFFQFQEKELKGTGIQLQAPPYFEGDTFTVTFPFKNKKTLSAKIKTLENLKEKVDELINFLQ